VDAELKEWSLLFERLGVHHDGVERVWLALVVQLNGLYRRFYFEILVCVHSFGLELLAVDVENLNLG